jgi:hypothetical protein
MEQYEKGLIENDICNVIGNILTLHIDESEDHRSACRGDITYYDLNLIIGRKIKFYKFSTYIIYLSDEYRYSDNFDIYVYNTINKSIDTINISVRNIRFEATLLNKCLVGEYDYTKEISLYQSFGYREVCIGRSNNTCYPNIFCIIDEYNGNVSIPLPDEIIPPYGKPDNTYLMESEIVCMFINRSFKFHHKKDDVMFKYTCDDMIESIFR